MASADPRDPVYGRPYTGTADVQTITITGSPAGGTYSLTFNGQTASGIAFNANATTIQTALRGLSTIGAGNVNVTGTGPFTVTFAGTKAPGYQNLITANGAGLTGGTSPAVTVTHATTGSPAQQVDPRGGSQTVLSLNRLAAIRVTTSTSDSHYTSNGELYHE